uniref:GRIP1 associated protein 1 n=1 Tax=Denticeps clupeoides TaxID=299321 RepID=A0AAY4DLM0_9TELE
MVFGRFLLHLEGRCCYCATCSADTRLQCQHCRWKVLAADGPAARLHRRLFLGSSPQPDSTPTESTSGLGSPPCRAPSVKMAQALSEEEFHRMQAQLLELRTQNYQLSDDLRKNTAELSNVRQKTLTLEKDYIKAQKVTISMAEVDALLSENEMLQGKLHSQEDDFRLQNSTLMQELSKLCSQIEQLEGENKVLKEGKVLQPPAPCPSPSSPVDGELLRLQAENSVLQKKLAGTWPLTKIDEIQQKKEEELKSMNVRIQKLQGDLMSANQSAAELREQLQSQQKGHELALQALREQVACQSAVSKEQVEGILSENDALRTNLAALEQIQTVKTQELNLLREQNMAVSVELQQRRTEQESLLAQRDDLSSQLQESNRANSRLLEQLSELGQEKERLQQELEEVKKTADKRKAMLDELAIEMAQEKSRHKEELSDVRLQHEKEVLSVRARYEKELRGLHEEKNRTEEELRAQLREEKARTRELEGLQHSVEELQAQVQSMEGTKGWFERRLKEAEPLLRAAPLFLLGSVSVQEIKDTVDGQRILEKKGSSALKDLKRQLQLERKRADKLQERLQEILTNTKTRTGLEELVLSEISSPSRTQQTGDSSSVSSFSYRETMKEGASAPSANKSNTSSPQSQRPAELSDDEVSELFQRLAEVQQEKWMLEEKVKHLEVSCSSMADDICKKSAIIETYVMDSRRGMAAVSRVVVFCSLKKKKKGFCQRSASLPITSCHFFFSELA